MSATYDMIRDGHKLAIHMGPDWSWKPEIICPGPGHCKARWTDGPPEGLNPCWLGYMADEFGSEFFEWWSDGRAGGFTGTFMLEGPFEIEWAAESGEEAETWWFPVRDEEQEATRPECLKAAA